MTWNDSPTHHKGAARLSYYNRGRRWVLVRYGKASFWMPYRNISDAIEKAGL